MQITRKVYHSKKYNHEYLTVDTNLHFDKDCIFCGYPRMHLLACKKDSYRENYSIQLTICDEDDYDIRMMYYPEPDQFTDVLRELINWMNDLEHGIICYDDFITDIDGFFPGYYGCKRESY